MATAVGSAHAISAVARRHRSRGLPFLPVVAFGADAGVLAVVALVSSWIAAGPQALADGTPTFEIGTGWTALALAASWLLILVVGGTYRPRILGGGSDEYKRVLNATLVSTGVSALVVFLATIEISRELFVLVYALGLPTVLLTRWADRKLLHAARRRGFLGFPVLVAGSTAQVDRLVSVLEGATWLGYDVVGAVTSDSRAPRTPAGTRIIGTTAEVTRAALDADVHVVLFAQGGVSDGQQLQERLWELEEHGVGAVVAPGVTGINTNRVSFQPVGGLPLLNLGVPAWAEAARFGKRAFDVVCASAVLLFFSPVMAFVALRIKFHDGGPVFFAQSRVGRQGEPFECLKFRTMVPDAEALLAALHVSSGHDGGLFKLENDPRITKPGSWLRRFSLDELPQLFNVLRGDMSLVGPRPPLPSEVATYDDAVRRRLHVRPGMTGLWQVSGRADLSWEESVRLDLYYVDNWSMLQDLHILFRTFGAVIHGRGAY